MVRSTVVLIAAFLIAIALASAAYGGWLLATVGAEFDPRGRIGLVLIVLAAALILAASFAFRFGRRAR